MSSINNSYALSADYSAISACLFAIQAQQASGLFTNNAQVLALLNDFESNLLKKLFNRTVRILSNIDGIVNGLESLTGEYEEDDFMVLDFHTGYLDTRNNRYSSRFQTVLNILTDLTQRIPAINSSDAASIDAVLIPVLDAFEAIQNILSAIGFNTCQASSSSFYNNSASLHLQAAGSDGSGGVAAGIHLRWSLTGELGDNHLPQGNYHTQSMGLSGFNKPNDFISLSRTAYVNPVLITVNFDTDQPAVNYGLKQWTYANNNQVGSKLISNRIRLDFTDADLYNRVAVIHDPLVEPYNFLNAYTGIIEIKVVNKTIFSAAFNFKNVTGRNDGILRCEAYSTSDISSALGDTPTVRNVIIADSTNQGFKGDNIIRLKLKNEGGMIQSFSFESYDDFINSRPDSDWTAVGSGFALSLDDNEVYKRLEDPGNYDINKLWPQYNNGTTVKVANYQHKWSVTDVNDASIKDTVLQYLTLSKDDPRAEDVIKIAGADADTPGMLISYLDVLNMMALDYHVARMLGLGYIDTLHQVDNSVQYVYRITYTNYKSLTGTETATYQYISLPTGRLDSRLPDKPVMRPLSYELPVDNTLSTSQFNTEGYASSVDVRIINIGRTLFGDEVSSDTFFYQHGDINGFSLFEKPKPVLYGIEYRPDGQATYVQPEITTASFKDDDAAYYAYNDAFSTAGILETVPVPDNATSLYLHFEKNPGVHHYALYGINLFSRCSLISDEAATDNTIFPLRNRLLPPADIAVQYIQKEEPLIFTTQTEQDWLKGRDGNFSGQDTSFTRVTFNWLDITDVTGIAETNVIDPATIVKPDKVKASFKPNQPLQVVGVITNMLPVADLDSQILLYTGKYLMIDGTWVVPVIAENDLPGFLGSLLITPQGQFKVIDVVNDTSGPIFKIEKDLQTERTEDPANPDYYGTRNYYNSPIVGSRFTVIENLSNTANWYPVTETISLVDFGNATSPVIETETDAQGNASKFLIGGITANASIMPLSSEDDQEAIPGYYRIAFQAGTSLDPHPQINLPFNSDTPGANSPASLQQVHVEWYKGVIRLPVNDGSSDKKLAEVVRIYQADPLVLYVYDVSYQDRPIQQSTSESNYSLQVNFHPGYRAYLFPEPSPTYTFNRSNILPEGNANSKKTLLGLQMADGRTEGSGFTSSISTPVVLLARNITKPVLLDAPIISNLKVRPDATSKAALTFDVKIAPDNGVARNPFGFMFYRTTDEDILEALYLPETVTSILSDLASLTQDDYFSERYLELANVIFDSGHAGIFKVFGTYGFPVPDKEGLVLPDDTISIKQAKYKAAINTTLMPLTEQPPIFSYLKTGTQTENKQPVIRTADGVLLNPADELFDPFPMARKYSGTDGTNVNYVRFTDYKLNGSSRFLYFYAAAEINNQLVPGPLSSFAGPVTILQTLPAAGPAIRSYNINPDAGANVTFYLSPFSSQDPISTVRIFRALENGQAISLPTMTSYIDVVINNDGVSGIDVVDTFLDLPQVPFGETIYYRLAFVRTISNELNEPEQILSLGSEVIAVNLVDVNNPPSPIPKYDAANNKLSCLQTTNNGTYYLYKQNLKGNWSLLTTVKPLDKSEMIAFDLPVLPHQDQNGNPVYNRFKIRVENSAGLYNWVDNEITI